MNLSCIRKPGSNDGFTLIELLVVLAILGMLAAIVGPQVIRHLGGAKVDTTRLQIKDLEAALDIYYLETGSYPNTEQGLEALIAQPQGVKRWNGPYLKKSSVPKDAWGNEYNYHSPGEDGRAYDLFSLGADNTPGGDGDNQDIASWE